MATITISNVSKVYGPLTVMNGLNVDISDGEFVVLVGPSGCGKSTLLRMIAGLEEISGGTVSIDSTIVNDLAPKDRNIAMVFQNYALYPHMTVAENMGFALRLAGVKKNEIARKVNDAASILGLLPLLTRFPGQLSGGQRQRVAMGRAIVRDPAVFLFDEPLSNLDAKLRVQMRAEIKELHQRLSTTIVYVTHDQIEAMTMADRIVVMRDGVIEQIGTPLELYDNPAGLFVASFIGSPSMNFVAGTLRDGQFVGDGGICFAVGEKVSNHEEVICGVRPDKILLAPTGVPAKVIVVEPTGAETLLVVEVGKTEMTVISRERSEFLPGQTVMLDFQFTSPLYFDAASGRRINART